MSNKKIFLLVAFFYIFISAFFYHPDIKTIFYQSQFLSKGVLNIYSFLKDNPDKNVLGPFVYPPFAYLLFGTLFIPVRLFAGVGFTQWLAMGNDAVWVDHIFRFIFAMKLPLLIFFALTGSVLMKLADSPIKQKMVLLFWFFNPVSLYVVGFMGQIDIVAIFLTVLALYFASKKVYLSAFFLGLGALTKSYPLLLLPFFALLVSADLKKQIRVFLVGFATYFVGILPFLGSSPFYESTFISGLSQRIFQTGISLGFGENILLVPFILFILFFVLQQLHVGNLEKIHNYFFLILTTIVVATHFHPQWVLWPIPFLALGIFDNKGKVKKSLILPVVLYFLGWAGTILLFDDKFLTWGLISTLDSGVLFLPTVNQLLTKYTDVLLIQSIFHTLLASAGIFLGIKLTYSKEL